MATRIRPNRLEVSDRFPMLGFTVRTDGPARRFEIAIGTSPDLFGPDGKSHRTRTNFYSTRAAGPLPIDSTWKSSFRPRCSARPGHFR